MERFGVFTADFPDDAVEENNDIVVPPGRNILAAVRKRLADLGVASAVAPEQRSHYGWTLDIVVDKMPVSLLIQNPDPWLMIASARGRRFMWPARRRALFERALSLIAAALEREPRIGNFRWLSRKTYESSCSTKG